MTIEDLKLNSVNNLTDLENLVNRTRQNDYNFVPEVISKIIENFTNHSNFANAIVLNSNFGEISSKLQKIKNVVNVDSNSNRVEISKYLNPNLTFINEDPLQYNSIEKFDLAVTFPPLGQRLEINVRHTQNKLHIEKALGLLNKNGVAIIVMPGNFLTAPIYLNTRNFILNNFSLNKIITLENGVIRNTGIELSIIEIQTAKVNKTEFYWLNSESSLINMVPNFSISKEELFERWDYNFHDPIKQKYIEQLNERETKRIGDLVEIYLGVAFTQKERKSIGKYKLLSPRNIINGIIDQSSRDYFIDKNDFNKNEKTAILKNGDILFSRNMSSKVSIYIHSLDDDKYIANQHIIILRGKNAQYVATYLNTDSGINLFNKQIERYARGQSIRVVSIADLANIQIPILPITDLEYASKNKLEKLTYNELLKINEKYEALQAEYTALKNGKNPSPHEEQLQSMQKVLQQVLQQELQPVLTFQLEHSQKLSLIENKIDDIKSIIINLSSDFKEIQNLPRDIEEKISRLNKKLEDQISNLNIEHKEIDNYIDEIKNWFSRFDLMEIKSQKYLPEAEFIFDYISTLENPDYSPYILQYCRALENELLTKIFRAYVKSLIERDIDFAHKFYWDLGKKESGRPNDENTFKLARHIQKCLTKNEDEWFFELGTMEINLRFLTGRTLDKSFLLQDLKMFVLDYFEKELLNIDYLDEIKTIIRDYRNQSAHPNLMNTEKALIFRKHMKQCLINLMENYKIK